MPKYLSILFAMFLLAGSSCMNESDTRVKTDALTDLSADKEALIKLTTEDWDANFLAGNPEANLYLYTEDAVRIQDGMILSGHEEISSILTTEVRPGFTTSTHENTIEDIRISGDLATVRGTFLGSWAHQEWGDTLWRKGTWVDVCERQEDGSWKMVFTMTTEIRE